MSPDTQLRWEARAAKPAAIAAFAGAAFTLVGVVIQLSAVSSGADTDRERLLQRDEHASDFALSVGAQAISYLLIAGALYYLLRATLARRPETPKYVLAVILLAPTLLIVGGVVNQIDFTGIADEFATSASGQQTEQRAEDLLEDRSIPGAVTGSAGALALALAFVLVALNAMRAGLLGRFMGVLGVVVGALLVLPLLPLGQFIVQVFWIVALGVLFLDRWPGGRGPAWETGEATPWPPAAGRRREARADGDGETVAGSLPANDPRDPQPAEADEDPDSDTRTPHAVSKKRKRKRRG